MMKQHHQSPFPLSALSCVGEKYTSSSHKSFFPEIHIFNPPDEQIQTNSF